MLSGKSLQAAAAGTSSPTLAVSIDVNAMEFTSSSPCHGDRHLHAHHVSPPATHSSEVTMPACSTNRQPLATRNQPAHTTHSAVGVSQILGTNNVHSQGSTRTKLNDLPPAMLNGESLQHS